MIPLVNDDPSCQPIKKTNAKIPEEEWIDECRAGDDKTPESPI
ncbi:hypothetical protein [Cyclobacterium salsum]|nr:hypothetical protein [Cyclobacterium salsum]